MTEEFAAAPKVVKPKKKYKQPQPEQNEEQQIKLIYNNLMWDKRVFRGNTHAALVTLKNVQNTQKIKPAQTNFKMQQQPVQIQNTANRRANIQIFTDEFVQTLTDKPPRYEYGSQTQPLPEKPVVRHRIPERKNVVEIQTQIWDNELFDFDYQVEPLINVLCGRILQVSRMEVLQQQELTVMRNRQEELLLEERKQNQKIKKMYEDQKKLQMENAKKIQQYKKEKQKKVKTHKRLFSRVLAKDFLKKIQNKSLEIVQRNGFFRNPLDIKIMNEIPSLLYKNSAQIANQKQTFVSEALKIAQQSRAGLLKQHAWAKQLQRTRRNQIIFKRQQIAREKLQRKAMKQEEAYMKDFLDKQKIQRQKQQQEKRLAQQAQQAGENAPKQES